MEQHADQLGATRYAELAKYAQQMRFYRWLRERQVAGDLLVG
jgi:hypothetical protein